MRCATKRTRVFAGRVRPAHLATGSSDAGALRSRTGRARPRQRLYDRKAVALVAQVTR